MVREHDLGLIKIQAQHAATASAAAVTKKRHEIIEELYKRFCELISLPDHQRRGRLFEGFLRDLFAATT